MHQYLRHGNSSISVTEMKYASEYIKKYARIPPTTELIEVITISKLPVKTVAHRLEYSMLEIATETLLLDNS